MSSKAKEPEAPKSKEAPAAATDAHGAASHGDAPPTKGAAFKQKLQNLKASLGEKVKGLPKPNPKEFFKSFGSGAKTVLKEIVYVPRWAFSNDGIHRVASLGFMASLALFVLTAPQVLLIVLKKPLTSAAPKPLVAAADHAPRDPATAPMPKESNTADHHVESVKQLDSVVFLEPFQITLTAEHKTLEFEAFAECADDGGAQKLKTLLPKAREVLTSLLQGQTSESFSTDSGKQELAGKIRQGINGVLGQESIKAIFITKSVLQ